MNKIIIHTDGGARGNPGPAAIGVVVCNDKGQVLKKYGEYLGDKFTNNQAEYRAVIFALKKVKALFGKKKAQNIEIEIRSDSELLVNQLNGKYKIVEPDLQPLFLQIWNLRVDLPRISFVAVPREKNKEADRLLNEALDSHLDTPKLPL